MSKQLNEPIIESGIPNTNFFNGRLLTASDLNTEQAAGRAHRQQLGQAIGEGVSTGLEVRLESPGSTTSVPVLSISAGLALNRKGQVLSLPNDTQGALARLNSPLPNDAGLFGECVLAEPTPATSGKGVYILTISPASGYKEKVPVRGTASDDAVTGCGDR